MDIKKILKLNKPVVWTIHDQFALTGGCHYSAGCDKFQENCSSCPQLKKFHFLPHLTLQDKIKLLKNENITIVGPSRWLYECARNSAVFKNSRVESFHYSIDESIYKRIDKKEAKQFFNINEESVTIIFGSDNGNEKRKGFSVLVDALHLCFRKKEFLEMIKNCKLNFLVSGEPISSIKNTEWPIRYTGRISNNKELNYFYSAGDLLILPSLEDNLPLTMLEAMCSGTPVVAFNVGGMRDIIKNEINGLLVELNDVDSLSRAIIKIITDPVLMSTLSHNSRKYAEDNFYLGKEADSYLSLFENIISQKRNYSRKVKENIYLHGVPLRILLKFIPAVFVNVLKIKVKRVKNNFLLV